MRRLCYNVAARYDTILMGRKSYEAASGGGEMPGIKTFSCRALWMPQPPE